LERDRTTAANERAWPKNARGSADFFAGASADAGNDGRLFALVVVVELLHGRHEHDNDQKGRRPG
jgi:hypothetical protein